MKIKGRLENWVYDSLLKVFWGNVYGDTRGRFKDGMWIHTSHAPFPEAQEGDIVSTLNSKYKLGVPRGPLHHS